MKSAALYARVSTAKQENEETIESQIEEIKLRIESDGNTLNLGHIFVDEGYSGSLLERPALDAMLDAAKNEEFDVVYIYDLGRLSRSLSHLLVVMEQINSYGREIISLHERITGTPEDAFLLQVMGAMHEFERAKIAERFRRGKMHKARSGRIVGYGAPYGYKYNKDTGEFEIDEAEAKVVKKVFNWVTNDGLSTYSIIKRLHEEGHLPRKRKQEYWSRGPIAKMLANETYVGKHHFNKTEAVLPRERHSSDKKYRKIQKTGRRMRARSEWIEFEVPAIITEHQFNMAREQIKKNSIFNPKNRKHDYLLTGLIYCSCGSRRNGDGPQDKKYYRCISRHKNPQILNQCLVGGVNVQLIDALVWKELESFLTDAERVKKYVNIWLTESREKSGTTVGSSSLNKELGELREQRQRYINVYGKSIITEEEFTLRINELNVKINALEKQNAHASKTNLSPVKISLDKLVAHVIQKISELNFSQKKHVVQQVVEKIVASTKEVTICGYIPVPVLTDVSQEKVNHVSRYRDRWFA